MTHRFRVARFLPLLAVVGVLIAIMAAPMVSQSPAEAAKGGNSQDVNACKNGGWQHLQTSDGRPFASQEECIAAGAHEAGREPPGRPPQPVIQMSFLFNDGFCDVTVDVSQLAAQQPYTVNIFARAVGERGNGSPFTYEDFTSTAGGTGSFGFTPSLAPDGQSELGARVEGSGDIQWFTLIC